MGVSGELLTIYAALPFVRQSGLYSISLPNKYNFSFDYYTFLILVMISYIPSKYEFVRVWFWGFFSVLKAVTGKANNCGINIRITNFAKLILKII